MHQCTNASTTQALPPKVKSIGPCADPPHEMYVVRFDLNQASQLCTFAVRTYAYTRAVGFGHWALGIGHWALGIGH